MTPWRLIFEVVQRQTPIREQDSKVILSGMNDFEAKIENGYTSEELAELHPMKQKAIAYWKEWGNNWLFRLAMAACFPIIDRMANDYVSGSVDTDLDEI